MKKLISMIVLIVMLQGVALAVPPLVEPPELTRLKFMCRVELIYISPGIPVGPQTIVEFEPFTSGVYLGHMLDPNSGGLFALCFLWPALLTDDDILTVSVWNKGGDGLMFDLPVKTFSWGGGS